MSASDLLSVYEKLQRAVLDNDDTELLIIKLFEAAEQQLPSLGIDFIYQSAIFLDESHQQESIYIQNDGTKKYDAYQSLNIQGSAKELYDNVNDILNSENTIKQSLTKNEIVTTTDVGKLIPQSEEKYPEIKTLLISPILLVNTLRGIIILGFNKEPNEITEHILQTIKIYNNLTSFVFRLQDTQASLSTITQQLYQTNAELHQLDKLKDQLIAVTSHELRTPATIVQNYLWMVLSKPDPDTKLGPKDTQRLQNSFTAIQNLIHLINDILDVSKIESGTIELNMKAINYEEILNNIIKDLMPKITSKNITIVLNKDKNVSETVYADEVRFKEVCTNLISNAIKFTDNGGIVINIKFESDHLVFQVKDTGRGISTEFLPKLFKKFYREDTSLTASNPETGGTGLGLYITKSIVELMHGKIWVESEAGKGTSFYFSLPADLETHLQQSEVRKMLPGVLTKSNYLQATHSDEKSHTQQAVLNKKKILLVEDDPDMQELYYEYLNDLYNITLARNGEEGLEKMEQEKFDLILLDIMMPKVDGIEFLEKKREHQTHFQIPVILLTNLGSEDVLNKCKQLGAKSAIIKSDITPDQIPPIIDKTFITT